MPARSAKSSRSRVLAVAVASAAVFFGSAAHAGYWAWLARDAASTVSVYYLPPVAEPGTPRGLQIWVRWEYAAPRQAGTESYQSVVELREVDCDAMRERVLQGARYAGADLTGSSNALIAEDWTPAGPGTLNEAVARFACSLLPPPAHSKGARGLAEAIGAVASMGVGPIPRRR
jgi:hypothetical protein